MAFGLSDSDIIPGLKLDQYRQRVRLDEPYQSESGDVLSVAEKSAIVAQLIDVLINGESLANIGKLPKEYERQRDLLRGLLNIRPPRSMDPIFLNNLNRLLHDETNSKEIADGADLPAVTDTIPALALINGDKFVLWRGDITCLKVDAIVNAANDQLLGCFHPMHNCIDNVIHSAAGPMLRQDCKVIMDIQQHPEQTGDAKITRAYNLPSRFVLHTVGPIIRHDLVSDGQQNQLVSSYRSCLTLANQIPAIKTIAFPCISTGVFSFPREMGTEIAILTVEEWLNNNSHHFERVIFNVYLQEDFNGYIRAFRFHSNR